MFFFCACPDDYEQLDANEKANRAKLSSDLCSIEKTSKFYIRALLELPLKQNPSGSSESASIVVTWGVWVTLGNTDFDKIVNNWNNNESVVVEGSLNNNLPVYNTTLGTLVTVTTRPGGFRPLITIKNSDNSPLSNDFQNGIPIDRLSSLIDFVLHTSRS